jgi:uncharacterized protein YjbJ (UPF0337 family)
LENGASGQKPRNNEERGTMDSDRIEGNLKEAEGKLTGDEKLEKEGQAQDSWGKAKDSTKDAVDDAKDAVDKRF